MSPPTSLDDAATGLSVSLFVQGCSAVCRVLSCLCCRLTAVCFVLYLFVPLSFTNRLSPDFNRSRKDFVPIEVKARVDLTGKRNLNQAGDDCALPVMEVKAPQPSKAQDARHYLLTESPIVINLIKKPVDTQEMTVRVVEYAPEILALKRPKPSKETCSGSFENFFLCESVHQVAKLISYIDPLSVCGTQACIEVMNLFLKTAIINVPKFLLHYLQLGIAAEGPNEYRGSGPA
ncbi:hypothetical protein J6590_023993 [Homalodisca vitripennis]|nr:hypothetical protein J6590_023993 [Homalodisca vitripennis]